MSGTAPPPYPGTNPAYPPDHKHADLSGQGPPPNAYPPPPNYAGPPPPPNYAGPPPGYGQPTQPGYQPGPTVVVQPTTVTTLVQTFRESPVQTVCPHCQAHIVTGTHHETGTFTYLICAIICLVGCDLGCCFIPFCVDGCKDVIHTCPNCQRQVARWSRL